MKTEKDDPRGGQRKSGRAWTLREPGIQDGQGVGELYLGEGAAITDETAFIHLNPGQFFACMDEERDI